MRADVSVVGAGPAGATAALVLASGGQDVLLVDRARFPRPKVCGDGLTPRAIAALTRLGIWERVREHATIVRDLRTIDLPSGACRSGPLPGRVAVPGEYGAVVSRTVLDDAIRRAAIDAGARVIEGLTIRQVQRTPDHARIHLRGLVGGTSMQIEAGLLVAADGASSRIAELELGHLPGRLRGIAVRQYWHVPTSASFTICVPIGRVGDDLAGYGWVFPVGADTANVGIGIVGDPVGVRCCYDGFIARLRALSSEWRVARPLGRLEGGALAMGLDRTTAAVDGILFAGDAAGAVNPFTGEGIAQAIESGIAAAESIVAHSGDRAAIEGHYRTALGSVFPETSRNVEWLPWLVGRGGARAREFWSVASRDDRLVARGARRMALEEAMSARSTPSFGPADVSWSRVCNRLRARRPVLAQFVEAVRDDVITSVVDVLVAIRGRTAIERDDAPTLDDVLVLSTLVLLLVTDATARVAARDPDESLACWAADSGALGVADLLLAEVFRLYAELPGQWSHRLSRASAYAFGDEARRSGCGAMEGDRKDVLARWTHTLFNAVSGRPSVVVPLR